MEHSQKALLPPLQSLQLSSLLTMKGGNLSQLNDYAMTHPACGECKHYKMQEKDQGQTNFTVLIALFSSGYDTLLFICLQGWLHYGSHMI